MDAVSRRTFAGPMVVVTWLVAVGWLVLGALSFLGLAAPGGVVLGVLGVLGGAATAWLAVSLRVPWDDEGVTLPRRGHVPWSQVDSVHVQPGVVSVPVLVLRQGRALSEVPLDGLAWFGGPDGHARTLAEKVALAAGVPEVGVRAVSAGKGRRAL